MIYLVAGWPGAGKSTVAVQHAIYRYASAGRRVAANFPIDFAPVTGRRESKLSRASCYVLPDRPSRDDLDRLGLGNEEAELADNMREERAGLLIIDEAGGWLNARTWQGQDREKIIDWMTQSRKRYWDIILIAQAPEMLDKQIRSSCCEAVCRLRRMDRIRMLNLRCFPRVHIGIVKYGLDANAPVIERWVYRGSDAHKCFTSHRLFGEGAAHYSVLPAVLTKWRYQPAFELARVVNRLPWPLAFMLLLPLAIASLFGKQPPLTNRGTGGRSGARRVAGGGRSTPSYKQTTHARLAVFPPHTERGGV